MADTVQHDAEDRDPLELLAEDFSARRRNGETLSVESFAAEHPQHAEDILDLFPAIAAMEKVKQRQPRRHDGRVAMAGHVPRRLGDYRLIHELGRGGMGVVYEAQQISLDRRVAVKVLPKQTLMSEKSLRRFQRESRTAAQLHHTNIVPVFGVGEQDGYHYLVMQLISGVGLDEVLAELRSRFGLETKAAANSPRGTRARAKAAALLSREFTLPQRSSDGLVMEALTDSGVSRVGRPTSARQTEFLTGAVPGTSTEEPSDPSDGPEAVSTGHPTVAVTGDDSRADLRGGGSFEVRNPELVPSLQVAPLGKTYWRNVAHIGLQVAEALDYAHTQGTLHRDIKPGNLLLDVHGLVWVADFGLAKLAEQDDVSQTGDIVGTLHYMAPETLDGATDKRSDLYSLGLTLYEMLTLRPAYSGATHAKVLEEVRRASPVRPKQLQPGIPRDLETIVLKLIALEPQKRYANAGELVADLQCFLEDRPIKARRTSPVEHAWRWCRRNPAMAGLSATALALLIMLATGASVGYVRENQARATETLLKDEALQSRNEALRAENAALQAKDSAESTLALAVEALENIYERFAPDQLVQVTPTVVEGDASEEATPEYEVRSQPELSQQTAGVLEEMLVFFDRFAQQAGSSDRFRFNAAVARRKVGDMRYKLGQYKQAEQAFQEALERFPEAVSQDPDRQVEVLLERTRTLNGLAGVYLVTGRFWESHAENRAALANLDQIEGGCDPRRSPIVCLETARTLFHLGNHPASWMNRGRRDRDGGRRSGREPGSTGRREGRERRDGDGGPPRGPDHGTPDRTRRSSANRDAASPEVPSGSLPMGPEFLGRAMNILTSLSEEHPNEPEYRYLLALCYRTNRRGSRNLTEQQPDTRKQALDILEELVTEFPQVPDYRYELCSTYANDPFVWVTLFYRKVVEEREEEWERQGNGPDVDVDLERARDLANSLVKQMPNIPRYHQLRAFVELRCASRLIAQRDYAAARDIFASVLGDEELSPGQTQNSFAYGILLTARLGMVHCMMQQLEAGMADAQQVKQRLQDTIDQHQAYTSGLTRRGMNRMLLHMTPRLMRWQARLLEQLGDSQGAQQVRDAVRGTWPNTSRRGRNRSGSPPPPPARSEK